MKVCRIEADIYFNAFQYSVTVVWIELKWKAMGTKRIDPFVPRSSMLKKLVTNIFFVPPFNSFMTDAVVI